jgi:hypothetical protein
MILPIFYRKIFISAILMFFSIKATSQLRTDGYYSVTKVSKTGDTTFHIICFVTNGQWADTSGTGPAPTLVSVPGQKNNTSCTYNINGNEVTATCDPVNLPQYHVSNCPCKYRIRIENNEIFVIDWRDNDKQKRNIKTKYLFAPFGN